MIKMSILGNITLIAFALVLLRRSTTTRLGRAAFAVVVFTALALLATYYLVDSFTGSGIDDSVLFLLHTGFEVALIGDFWGLIATGAALAAVTLAISVYTYRAARAETRTWKSDVRVGIGVGVLALAFYFNPAVTDIFALVSAERAAPDAETASLETPEHYVPVGAVGFETAPKNLVLLYLESAERTFFDETLFPELMPNMVALEKQALSFTDLTETTGTSWTIAGMIASQCGIPLSGSSGAGADKFLPEARCVGDVLNDSGFELNYMSGTPIDFAGEGIFYRTHGFQRIEGREELLPGLPDPDYRSFWGLHDDSLLTEAQKRYDMLSANDSPFGLVALTVDTHHPSGAHIPKACDDYAYQDGENGFLNSVHCLDMLVGDFIRHVIASPNFDDTILVVVSDHMARPNQATDILETGARRNLFMAFGADLEPQLVAKPGNTLDIAPTMLGLLGAPTDALAYGRDLLAVGPTLRSGSTPLDDILIEDRPFLSSLWAYPRLDDGFEVDMALNRLLLNDRYVELPVLIQLDENLEVDGLSYEIEGEAPLLADVSQLYYNRRFIWIDHCRNTALFNYGSLSDFEQYCAMIGSLGSAETASFALEDGQQVKFSAIRKFFDGAPARQELYDFHISEWQRNVEFADTMMAEFAPPTALVGHFAIRSAGYPSGYSWVLNRETGERVELVRGLTLLGLNPEAAPVKLAHKDSCAYDHEVFDINIPLEGDLLTVIEQNRAAFGAMVIVGDSSMVCYEIDPHLDEIFAGTGFSAWADIWYNQPYIAVLSGNGNIQEFVGEESTALGIELENFVQAAP